MRTKTRLFLLAAALATWPIQASADEKIDSSINDGIKPDDRTAAEGYWDDADHQQAGRAGVPGLTTTGEESEVMARRWTHESFAVRPQLGVLLFERADSTDSRAIGGITMEWNAGSLIKREDMAMENAESRVFLGPSTGVLYSRLGDSTTDFFGSNSDVSNSSAADMLLIPANIKAGYAMTDAFRVSAHGGANVVYRASIPSVSFGADALDNHWSVYPNAGLDFEVGLARSTSLLFRPDVTFTPGADLYSGTLGLGISLG